MDLVLATVRLRLDALREDDADELFRYRADPVVARYQGWRPTKQTEALDFIRTQMQWSPETRGDWVQRAIRLTDHDALIGDLGLHIPVDTEDSYEFGITIAPEHQGKGYAYEAVRGLFDYLFDTFHARRIHASIDPRNQASDALMRALGMRQEAHFRERFWLHGEWVDDMIFAILAREWPEARKRKS
ncbi:GNAT family N-acetyltransferase [Dyella dinghuensis]|uniref:GNAT family N-acetyltransferase n=1 Tax=Dyella dinghuensis TaxID=1920169 RepID=UPI001F455C99|nr:GNAT family protein [Dyella dinghuensis]